MKPPVRNDSGQPVDEEALAELCRRVQTMVEEPLPAISVACVEDETMVRLHEQYYGEAGSTDVLAFPYDEADAEIVLNPSYLPEDPAVDAGERLVELLVHGVLHLAGFDHTRPDDDGAHRARQEAIMRRLRSEGLPDVLATDEPPGADQPDAV